MVWKIIGYVGAALIILALTIGIGVKMTQKAEGYKADEQNFYTFEPHFMFGGCARYDAIRKPDAKVEKKQEIKVKEVKK